MKARDLCLIVLAFLLCVFTPASVFAQSDATSYRVNYYNPGATAPMQQTDVFPASEVQCNQAPPVNPSTVNPSRAVWTDVANSTPTAPKVCGRSFPAVGTVLTAFPVGTYEATLVAINGAGESGESNRASFSRAALPAVRQGFGFTR